MFQIWRLESFSCSACTGSVLHTMMVLTVFTPFVGPSFPSEAAVERFYVHNYIKAIFRRLENSKISPLFTAYNSKSAACHSWKVLNQVLESEDLVNIHPTRRSIPAAHELNILENNFFSEHLDFDFVIRKKKTGMQTIHRRKRKNVLLLLCTWSIQDQAVGGVRRRRLRESP